MNPSPERAQALIARHRWDLAERELTAVLATDPHDPMALALLALGLAERRRLKDARRAAREALEKAHAIAASRGVRLRERIVRARSRGEAIVAEAEAAHVDLIVMRAAPKNRKRLFGRTADYVLRHADCRVLVTAPRP